ncbi:MAG: ester cyclase [Hespellia sp.]|nr:ester cyclase [Hespellia sp.]
MEEKNKEVIRKFYQEFFNDHVIESADKYVREDYIQHNPGVDQGRESLKSAFADKFIGDPDFRLDIKMMIAEKDMVAVYLKNVAPDGTTKCRVVDIYRLKDGMLAEHWDVLQPCN